MADIVDRIRKLLSLSRSSNPNEAAAAAAMAARLMAKHGIESVEDIEGPADPIGINEDLVVDVGKALRPLRWKWQLAWAVACSARCKPLMLHRSSQGRHVATVVAFVGRKSDSKICAYVYPYLLKEIVRLHDEMRPPLLPMFPRRATPEERDAWRGQLREHRIYLRRWGRDFYNGAVETLRQRMDRAYEDVMRTATSTALVRIDNIKTEIDQIAFDLGVRYAKTTSVVTRTAGYDVGMRAGRSIDLSRDHGRLAPGAPALPSADDDR